MTKEELERIEDIVHKTIYDFFEFCADNEEAPMTRTDDLLLEVNKTICENIKALEQEPQADDMTNSHSEKDIYKGCINLMWELMDTFYEWLDFIGVDITKLDEEEQFERRFCPTHIVERLFLWNTTHSGGTSQHMKCDELGIDTNNEVIFDFSEELESEE